MDLGTCWQSDAWADGSWQTNVWCPSTPPPPPVVTRVEDRKWPGPSIVLYREGETDTRWLQKRKREDEEIFIL